jgi:hypothetical protein
MSHPSSETSDPVNYTMQTNTPAHDLSTKNTQTNTTTRPIDAISLTYYSSSSSDSETPNNAISFKAQRQARQKQLRNQEEAELDRRANREEQVENCAIGASGGVATGWRCGDCGTVRAGSVVWCMTVFQDGGERGHVYCGMGQHCGMVI